MVVKSFELVFGEFVASAVVVDRHPRNRALTVGLEVEEGQVVEPQAGEYLGRPLNRRREGPASLQVRFYHRPLGRPLGEGIPQERL